MNLKFNDTVLLDLALERLGIKKQDFKKQLYRTLNLATAKQVNIVENTHTSMIPNSDTHHTSKTYVYETNTHTIKATKYGRIQNIVAKKQRPKLHVKSQYTQQTLNKPIITYKRKKLIK